MLCFNALLQVRLDLVLPFGVRDMPRHVTLNFFHNLRAAGRQGLCLLSASEASKQEPGHCRPDENQDLFSGELEDPADLLDWVQGLSSPISHSFLVRPGAGAACFVSMPTGQSRLAQSRQSLAN